ncbi:MAG: FtsQ-type POTRA domain-containing protein [Burkholderiales bacterium]|nr:FtsQ-type POTRA domain-containing protein [Burkholderiales bacterium]
MFDNVKLINRLAFLIGAIAVSILALSLVYYSINNWFQINKIIVHGNVSNLTQENVSKMVQNRLHGTFFTLNIDIIQREFEQLPWVKDVHVTREFPDTIKVSIIEYQPIINLGNGKLLSQERLIFNGLDKKNQLPLFTVPNNQIDNALSLYDEIKPFISGHRTELRSLVFNGVGLTKIGFSNGMIITICDGGVFSQLQLLGKYWKYLQQIESNITSINMCYKNALAIKG